MTTLGSTVLAIYVYYRVPRPALDAATAAVRDMFAELARHHPGLNSSLHLRADGTGDSATLMEIHCPDVPHSGQGMDDLLGSMEREAGVLAGWLDGRRHVEIFHRI